MGLCTVDEVVYETQPQKLLLAAAVALMMLSLLSSNSSAWNIPGHMLSGAIAYQILQRESPTTIPSVRSVLEKNPWYQSRWKSQLDKLPEAERDETLFMVAARWADDIRTRDPSESHPQWHYIDFPFKPEGEPASIQIVQPPHANILTAIAENTRILGTGSDPVRQVLLLHGFSILLATFTSRSMPSNSSRGNTQTVIAAAVISAFGLARIAPRYRCIAFGMG